MVRKGTLHTKPARVQEAFRQRSQAHKRVSWGCPMQGQELHSMVLVSQFQLRIFFDTTPERYSE